MTDANKPPEVVFSLEKIYLKDVSYEAPLVPHAFLQEAAPQIGVQLGATHSQLDAGQGIYEVVLSITVTATQGEKTVFLVEVHQGGLFRLQGVEGEVRDKTLGIACPHMLLPFAREAVADFIGKGGFPPLLLQPINFEALYEQRQATATASPAQA